MGKSPIETRECGCEASIVDGFLYHCCPKHEDQNPCLPYWPPELQEAARRRSALARRGEGK